MECILSLEPIGREIGTRTHGMHSEIHWHEIQSAGNRDSWECILRFIGREIGTHGNAF